MNALSYTYNTATGALAYLTGFGGQQHENHGETSRRPTELRTAQSKEGEAEAEAETAKAVARVEQAGPVQGGGGALLPDNAASLITALSLVSRLSLRFTTIFLEAMLESARFSSSQSLSLTRRALITAVSSARSLNLYQSSPSNDAQYLSMLDKYTNLGAYWIHTSFTLTELFAMSGFSLAGSLISTASTVADESFRLLDAIFGSTDSSRALASIIWLVRKELLTHPRRTGAVGFLAQLRNLVKAVVAFALLQNFTWRHTVRTQKLVPLFDATIVVNHQANSFPSGPPSSSESSTKANTENESFPRIKVAGDGHNAAWEPSERQADQNNHRHSRTFSVQSRSRPLDIQEAVSAGQTWEDELATPPSRDSQQTPSQDEGDQIASQLEAFLQAREDEDGASSTANLSEAQLANVPALNADDANLMQLLQQLQHQPYEIETVTTQTTTTIIRILDERLSPATHVPNERDSIPGVEDWVLTRRASSCCSDAEMELENDSSKLSSENARDRHTRDRFKFVLRSMSQRVQSHKIASSAPSQSTSHSSSRWTSPSSSVSNVPSSAASSQKWLSARKDNLKRAFSRKRRREDLPIIELPPPTDTEDVAMSGTESDPEPPPNAKPRVKPPSIKSMHSLRTIDASATHSSHSWMSGEPRPSNFPQRHLVHNVQSFCRYSSASYGQTFLRVFGIGGHNFDFPSTPNAHSNHHAFCAHTGLPLPALLLSSFAEPSSFDNTRAQNMVYYIAVDQEAQSIVLTCRGSLGLSDIITDLTAEFEEVSVPHAPSGQTYLAHQGMLAAARKLLAHRSRVHDTIAQALRDHPDYGLVLTGHSLGGGVAALLAILLACPKTVYNQLETEDSKLPVSTATSKFVIAPDSGLPPGRAITAFAYGVPSTTSIDLADYAEGLVTSIVHGNDLVPSLSLGAIRDLVKLSNYMEDEPDLSTEVIGRVSGLYRDRFKRRGTQESSCSMQTDSDNHGDDVSSPLAPHRSHPGEGVESISAEVSLSPGEIRSGRSSDLTTRPGYSDPRFQITTALGTTEDVELEKWLLEVMQVIRTGNDSLKLYPPGDVFLINVEQLFVTCREDQSFNRQEGQRVVFHKVEDRTTRFGEPIFSKGMLFDHSPGNYEIAIDALSAAVLQRI